MIMEQAVRKEMARFISLSKEYTAWSDRAILHDKKGILCQGLWFLVKLN